VIVLAIDTSTSVASIALVGGEGLLLAELSVGAGRRHGGTLLPRIEVVLAAAGVAFEDVGLLAVGTGPGSFTGLRVGLATMKGLALARGLPVVGVPSLVALARGLGPSVSPIVPVVDAQKGELFAAAYRVGDAVDTLLAPFHAPPAEAGAVLRAAFPAEPLLVGGDGLRKHREPFLDALGEPRVIAGPVHDAPRAAHLAVEALRIHAEDGPADLDALEPLYVRPADAKLPASPR
jgi:tRNA threonylcarbamoyladenosine biosynthesis protein TsaB